MLGLKITPGGIQLSVQAGLECVDDLDWVVFECIANEDVVHLSSTDNKEVVRLIVFELVSSLSFN